MFLMAYLAAFGFGVVLIGAAMVLGDHDHDVDKDIDFAGDIDVDVDVDADVDVDHVAGDAPHGVERKRWVPFFSARFWTYALGTGGATGSALTFLGLPAAIHLPAALGSGLVLGWIAAWSFRKLKHATADSTIRPATLKGTEGRVVLAIRPGAIGKIRLHVQGQSIELLARTREDRVLEAKEPVLIVQVDEDTAVVTPVPSLTQKTHS